MIRSPRGRRSSATRNTAEVAVTKRKEGRLHYIFLGLAILAETAATLALQASSQFTRLGPSVIVVQGYGFSFYFTG